MFRYVSLLLCTFIILFSCKSQSTSTDVHMQLVMQDNYSGAVEEELLLVKSQKALNSFFAKINRTRKPGLTVPEVDFTKVFLIIWCPGEGYSKTPELSLKKETDKELVIKKNTSAKKTINTSFTSPFSIYKLPISKKKIVLE